MKNIVVKNSFRDKEDKGKKRNVGETILVTLERARRLIELGFAVAATVQEAKEIMKQEPKDIAVFKDESQWNEPVEVNNKPKKVAPKKVARKK